MCQRSHADCYFRIEECPTNGLQDPITQDVTRSTIHNRLRPTISITKSAIAFGLVEISHPVNSEDRLIALGPCACAELIEGRKENFNGVGLANISSQVL